MWNWMVSSLAIGSKLVLFEGNPFHPGPEKLWQIAEVEKICPEARNLLLIPENHTRNTFYLSNVAQLQRIFHMAGLNVRIGSINPDIKEDTCIDLPNGDSVLLEPVIRSSRRLGLKHFDPCTILLNNDLSAGVPGILEDLNDEFEEACRVLSAERDSRR